MKGKDYWTKKLGKKWTTILRPLLQGPYATKLMDFIEIQYAFNDVYPKDSHIFEAFAQCKYDDLRVVIIGDEIIKVAGYNHSFLAPGTCYEVLLCLEKDADRMELDFDTTLNHWGNQGVLMLNSSLTSIVGQEQAHKKQWSKFIINTILLIKANNPSTIFVLWGDSTKERFLPLLQDCNIFTYEAPIEALNERREWNCPNFREINELLVKLNGKEEEIKWL